MTGRKEIERRGECCELCKSRRMSVGYSLENEDEDGFGIQVMMMMREGIC